MTYLRVKWNHSYPDEPIELFSELDAERYETRKIEVFRNGVLSFAGPPGSSSGTHRSETPLPLAEEIAQDLQFIVCPCSKEEFEQLWRSVAISTAA